MANAVVGSKQKAFEIADYDMYPRQPLAGLFWRRNPLPVKMLFRQAVKRRQRIGPYRYPRRDSPMGKVAYTFLIYGRYGLHRGKAGPTVKGLTGDEDIPFSRGAAPALSRPLSSKERIIEFDDVTETIEGISVPHGLAQLTQHGKGRGPADANELGQSQCGKAAFVGRDPVDRPKPLGQRQLWHGTWVSAVTEVWRPQRVHS